MRTPQIILALDVDSRREALRFVRRLYPQIKIFKVGLQLYTACGPKIIQDIRDAGAEVFLDLKFNDIPNTMAAAVKEAVKHKVAMLTVHTLSGPTALQEVSRAALRSRTKILGVTILTSICPHFLKDLKVQRSLCAEVLYLAKLAQRCGLDGVVCSVREAALLRKALPKQFMIITPGIRPDGPCGDDQKRVAMVKEAMRAGSDFLVIGRPILKARNPQAAAQGILDSVRQHGAKPL